MVMLETEKGWMDEEERRMADRRGRRDIEENRNGNYQEREDVELR